MYQCLDYLKGKNIFLLRNKRILPPAASVPGRLIVNPDSRTPAVPGRCPQPGG
jgi:hypothetical protein